MRDRRLWRRLVPLGAGLILAVATLATMSWTEPPRFDGAGYATLGRSLAEGRGYRVISDPAAPPHAHFPPGYPVTLALVWALVGSEERSTFVRLAHAESLALLVVGVWAVGRWWGSVESRGVATSLTLALAVNWTWIRTGGVIRSEPLAIALGGLILWLGRPGPRGWSVIPRAALVGLAILTRQVAACWAVAVAVDFGFRAGWRAALRFLVGVALVVAPWVGWQVWVGVGSQSSLFRRQGLPGLVLDQTLFYARRLPDMVVGPFVEVATVFGRSPWLARVATVGAVGFAMVVGVGWVRSARVGRRRLGGLVPLATMPLLLVWPFTEAGRFLIPLVPFILMGAVEGGSVLLAWFRWPRPKLWAARLILAGSIPYSAYALVADRAGAERRLQRDFDAGCAWIAAQRDVPGPVMARHAGDVAWLTGRLAVAIPDGGPAAIAATIRRNHVAFLLIDDARYAQSPANPLHSFVDDSNRVRPVWTGGAATIYQVDPTAF